MAYNITYQKFVVRTNEKAIFRIKAVLDDDSDLVALGTDFAPGSTAVVADGGKAYILNASNQWKAAGTASYNLAEGVSF